MRARLLVTAAMLPATTLPAAHAESLLWQDTIVRPESREIDAPALEPEPPPPAQFVTLDADLDFTFPADLDSGGDFHVTRTRLGVGWNAQIAEGLRLGLDFSYEASFFDFDGADGLLAGTDDPWSDLHSYTVGATLFGTIDDDWGWIAGANIRSGMESGADFSDSLTYGGFAGITRKIDESLSLTFGVAARTRLEDDARVLPAVGVDWRINNRLRLTVRGAEASLTQEINDAWSVGLVGAYQSRDWRLDDSGSAPLPDGVVRERRIPVGIELAYEPDRALRVAALAGAVVWHEFEIRDDDSEVLDDESDISPFLALSVRLRF